MALPLAKDTKFGIQTRLPTPDLTEKTVEMLDTLDFDSVWVGDHLAFTLPILDPFVQLAHEVAPAVELIVPGAHGAGAVEPVAQDEPSGQSVQSVAAPRPNALE